MTDPGLTTEVALVIDFLLGALAQRDTALVAGVGVATAIVLAVPFAVTQRLGRGSGSASTFEYGEVL